MILQVIDCTFCCRQDYITALGVSLCVCLEVFPVSKDPAPVDPCSDTWCSFCVI